jgi:hypothetical protein
MSEESWTDPGSVSVAHPSIIQPVLDVALSVSSESIISAQMASMIEIVGQTQSITETMAGVTDAAATQIGLAGYFDSLTALQSDVTSVGLMTPTILEVPTVSPLQPDMQPWYLTKINRLETRVHDLETELRSARDDLEKMATRSNNEEQRADREEQRADAQIRRADRASAAYAHLDNRQYFDDGEDEWDERSRVDEG